MKLLCSQLPPQTGNGVQRRRHQEVDTLQRPAPNPLGRHADADPCAGRCEGAVRDQDDPAQRIHRPTRLADRPGQRAGRILSINRLALSTMAQPRRSRWYQPPPGYTGQPRPPRRPFFAARGPGQLRQRRITDRGKLGDGQGERAWAGVIACLGARACGPRRWPWLPSCSAGAACSAVLRRCRRTIR